MLRSTAQFAWPLQYGRYVLSSAVALGADFITFLSLLELEIGAVFASVVAYTLGLGIHWLLSSRVVFADAVAIEGTRRRRQRLLFVASAVLGLAVTAAVIQCADQLKLNPGLSKAIAAAVSFQLTYLIRRTVVFS